MFFLHGQKPEFLGEPTECVPTELELVGSDLLGPEAVEKLPNIALFPGDRQVPFEHLFQDKKENSYHIEVVFFMIEVQIRGRPTESWPD